jgi:hypothetical protein
MLWIYEKVHFRALSKKYNEYDLIYGKQQIANFIGIRLEIDILLPVLYVTPVIQTKRIEISSKTTYPMGASRLFQQRNPRAISIQGSTIHSERNLAHIHRIHEDLQMKIMFSEIKKVENKILTKIRNHINVLTVNLLDQWFSNPFCSWLTSEFHSLLWPPSLKLFNYNKCNIYNKYVLYQLHFYL